MRNIQFSKGRNFNTQKLEKFIPDYARSQNESRSSVEKKEEEEKKRNIYKVGRRKLVGGRWKESLGKEEVRTDDGRNVIRPIRIMLKSHGAKGLRSEYGLWVGRKGR